MGFRPDAASVDDSREKFTPAQNMIFSRKSAPVGGGIVSKFPKMRPFLLKKAMHR
ncbi:phage polarity suppression protein [Escherichia coli]